MPILYGVSELTPEYLPCPTVIRIFWSDVIHALALICSVHFFASGAVAAGKATRSTSMGVISPRD